MRCVCSASHGQPPGARSRAFTRTRSRSRSPPWLEGTGPSGTWAGALAHADGPEGADGVTVPVAVLRDAHDLAASPRRTGRTSGSRRPRRPDTCSCSQSLKTVRRPASSSCSLHVLERLHLLLDQADHVPAELRLHGLGDLTGLQRDRGLAERRRRTWRPRSNRGCRSSAWRTGRSRLLREVQEVLLGGTRRGDLGVDVVGLGLRSRRRMWSTCDRDVAGEACPRTAGGGRPRPASVGDGRLHLAEQQEPVREVRQVGARRGRAPSAVSSTLLLPEAVVELRDRLSRPGRRSRRCRSPAA